MKERRANPDTPRNYDGAKADMWSVGAITFGLLVGTKAPWTAKDFDSLHYAVTNKNFSDMFPKHQPDVSDDCLDLLSILLHTEPEERADTQALMSHAFITNRKPVRLENSGEGGWEVVDHWFSNDLVDIERRVSSSPSSAAVVHEEPSSGSRASAKPSAEASTQSPVRVELSEAERSAIARRDASHQAGLEVLLEDMKGYIRAAAAEGGDKAHLRSYLLEREESVR